MNLLLLWCQQAPRPPDFSRSPGLWDLGLGGHQGHGGTLASVGPLASVAPG